MWHFRSTLNHPMQHKWYNKHRMTTHQRAWTSIWTWVNFLMNLLCVTNLVQRELNKQSLNFIRPFLKYWIEIQREILPLKLLSPPKLKHLTLSLVHAQPYHHTIFKKLFQIREDGWDLTTLSLELLVILISPT